MEKSKEREVLNQYIGQPIENVPKEYKEKIAKLREYGLGVEEKSIYEQIIEWMEKNDGKMPNAYSHKKMDEMTKEERKEMILYDRWRKSKEREVLNQYIGQPIENVPEEYREKIAKLRAYGLGIKEKSTYEQIMEWLEMYEGKMPREKIVKNGITLSRGEMTKEERKEMILYDRWRKSKEREVLNQYIGQPIENVPEEYREKIAKLRAYGLGIKEKSTYEQIMEWLEMHDGKIPRASIAKNGITLSRGEMTKEERYEVNLHRRWTKSEEKTTLDEYAGRPLEEVPEEYREKIAKLRSLGYLGTKKDDKIKGRMKKAVGKAVGENGTTREELGEIKRS